MIKWDIPTTLLTLMVILGACSTAITQPSGPPQIKITEVRSRAADAGANSAVYLKITNEGGSADVLLGVETDIGTAELHETKMDENDVMRMGPIPNVEIPAGGSINLEPGGKHIMLLNLKQGLNPGDRITLTLTFQQTGSMIVEAEVRERDENLSMEHHFRRQVLDDR